MGRYGSVPVLKESPMRYLIASDIHGALPAAEMLVARFREEGADRLLLDNMGPPMLREAVALVAGRVPTEASGGVNLQSIRAIAETGVTYISVGRLTQSAPAADIGMDYLSEK